MIYGTEEGREVNSPPFLLSGFFWMVWLVKACNMSGVAIYQMKE